MPLPLHTCALRKPPVPAVRNLGPLSRELLKTLFVMGVYTAQFLKEHSRALAPLCW